MAVIGVQDLEDRVGVTARDEAHFPLELGVASLTGSGAPVQPVDVGLLVTFGVDAHALHAGPVVAVAIADLHPVGVGERVAQALAVDEDPGVGVRDQRHVEVVGVTVVGVVDLQRGIRLVVRAVHDRGPDELGFTSGTPARADVEVGEVQLALIVDLFGGFVVARIAPAGLATITVVPAVVGEVVDAGHGLGLGAFGPTTVLAVEDQMEMGPRMLAAGGAHRVAGVAHQTDGAVDVDRLSQTDVDVSQVTVAAVVALTVVDDHGVAVALVTVAVVGHLAHVAISDRGHLLAVGIAAIPGEVQSVAIVAILEPPVLVRAGVVGLGDHPPLAGGEGQRQVGHATTVTVVVRSVVVGIDDVAVLAVLVLQDVLQARDLSGVIGAATAEHEQKGQNGPESAQHWKPPCALG